MMLCQASTATVFSSCLFLGHFPFSIVFSKWNACSIGFRSGDWLGHCITFHFFAWKNSLVAFAVFFGSFLDVVWQTLIWSSCFWGSPMVYILWWTLCIHSGEVFSWLLTLTHIHLPPGECSWSGQLLWRGFSSPGKEFFCHPPQLFVCGLPGLLVLLSSTVRSFFLRMFQTVDLAKPNVFAISLIGLFWFFSLMMACFTDSDSSLDLILRVDSNRFQMQIAHLKWTLDLLSAIR